MKIVHFADTHIGPFPGPVVSGKNVRAEDTLRCFDELVAITEAEQPDLIIHAGDLFHAAKTWSERGISEVNDAIQRIEHLSKIAPVVIIQGTKNHDGDEHFSMLQRYFKSNPDVSIYTKPGCYKVGSADGYVNICALPGFDKGYWRAQHPGIDREQESQIFADDLEKMIIGMKAFCNPHLPSVLVAHYTVDGANTESGQTMMFGQFDPIITHRALVAAGYDLCCFGHIHKPQELGANAFYSGSINRITFNDENDRRGFYVHTLDGHTLTNSEFIELESPRKFKTVVLDGANVKDFNLSGMLPFFDVQDAIVRVIYDCAEEDHKALNRAQMEKALMDAGAFWVQEITPRNIAVTVNRVEIDNENDPEENLRDYLTANDVPHTDIRDALDLGRDIIDKALADSHADKASGLFSPVEISVTNYRNYRDETFSFDDVRFATINGQNGVGKSSLFMDALYDALFEDPREGDLTGWICNDAEARSGAIQLVFRVGDKLWRVVRTRMKSGKATLNLSEKVDGEWIDRSCEKLRDTQAAIERVIGMDGQTLRACALIMQDQYGLFLQADKESRMQILSNILGLGVYERMAEISAERATDVNREVRNLQQRKTDLSLQTQDMRDLLAEYQQIETNIKAHDGEIARLNAEMDARNAELTAAQTVAARYDEIRSEVAGLNEAISRAESQRKTAQDSLEKFNYMLAMQQTILDGAARYREAIAQRESLQERAAGFAVFLEKRTNIRSLISRNDQQAERQKTLITQIEGRIEALKKTLTRREEYERQQQEFEQISAAVKLAEEVNAEYGKADAEVIAAQRALQDCETKARYEAAQRTAEIENLKRRIAMLDNSGCPVSESATCRFLADAIAARKLLPDAEANHVKASEAAALNLDKLRQALRASQAARDAIQRVDDQRLKQLKARLTELSEAAVCLARMDQYAAELATQEKALAEAAEQYNALLHERDTAKSGLAEVEKQIQESEGVTSAYNAATETIRSCRIYADQEQQLAGAKDRRDAAKERMDECQVQINGLTARLNEKLVTLDGEALAFERIQKIKAQIVSLKNQIIAHNGMRDLAMGSKAACQAKIDRAKETEAQIKIVAHEIEDKSHEAAIYDLLKNAFGSNGIPHNIMRGIIPVFEATASNILGQMSHGRMAVELVTEKVLKSNSKKEVTTLDVVINDADTGRLPYLSRSGGERVKAALSVILALSEVMKNKLGVQLGFLFLDEPPFLDSDGVHAYVEALEAIQTRYEDMRIMAITHDEAMKSMFPQAITVTKDEMGSHAVME